MARKTRRYVLVIVVVVLMLVVVLALGLTMTKIPRGPQLPITLVSVTNSPAGEAIATFLITNPYPQPVWFTPAFPQTRLQTGWQETIFWRSDGSGGTLAAKVATNFSVVVSTNDTWRVPVSTVFIPTRMEHWRRILNVNWRVYSENGTLPGLNISYGLTGETNFSDEFEVPEVR